jgi:cytochrome P450
VSASPKGAQRGEAERRSRGAALEYDPFDWSIQRDPYPLYRRMRDEAPAYHNQKLGFWALSRYADVLEATLDWETWSSAGGVTVEGEVAFPILISMDPPRHTRLRNLVSKAFTRRRVAELEPVVRALAVRLLDPFAGERGMDLVQDFAARLPMDVISHMLGIPPEDRDAVRGWSNLLLEREERSAERPAASFEAEASLADYFRRTLERLRRRPEAGLMSALLAAEVEDEEGMHRLSEPEILGFCILLAAAGNETVTRLLGSSVLALSRFPGERARLVAEPALLPAAVEELLRYDPPSHYQGRTATREVAIHGQRIPKGARVLLMTGAACRDEREYPEPDRLLLGRRIERQIAFGYGHHICLGASLARLEMRVSLEELHRRFPVYEVDESRLELAHSSNVRGYASVPLRFG